MTKDELVERLNDDLCNEYKHFHFYLHSALMVQGLHREEIKEYCFTHAASEMKHVQEFGEKIVGMGGHPNSLPHEFPTDLTCPHAILQYALEMEDEVVANYVTRMDEAAACESHVDGRVVEIFLENQIDDSRADADHLREMVKSFGFTPQKKECCK